jgi:asparagine synthetase B (glutamine-hydrolysing)
MWYLKNYFDGKYPLFAGLRNKKDKKLNREAVLSYLGMRFNVTPNTVIDGVTKTYIDGSPKLPEGNLTDLLVAQKPDKPFALLLSGGVDSSVLAKLYDGPDTHFIFVQTLLGQERQYFDLLAKTLKGHIHVVTLTPRTYYDYACKLYDEMDEPVGDAAIISVYAGALHAKLLGLDTIVVGEGGDETFGGYWLYPDFIPQNNDNISIPFSLVRQHASLAFKIEPKEIVEYWNGFHGNCLLHQMQWDRNVALRDLFLWKNQWGAHLAGCECIIPFYHPQVGEWAALNLKTTDLVDWGDLLKTKVYLKNMALNLGVPVNCVIRNKMGFASEMNHDVWKWMSDDTGFNSQIHIEMYPLWSLDRWCKKLGVSFNWREYVKGD